MEQDKQRFKVNFSGILSLLSQHLYASSDVFVRELIQNAHDAIQFRRNIDPDFYEEGHIHFEYVEQETGDLLIVEDNGCGMEIEEVEKFLSRIGSSSKRGLTSGQDEGLIGQFGIGLLSCFMVGDKMTLFTKSYKHEKAVKWEAYIEGTYASSDASLEMKAGTKLFLPLRKDETNTYDAERIKRLIQKYGTFLPLHISFQVGDDFSELSRNSFPWEGSPSQIIPFGQEYFQGQFKYHIPLSSKSGKTQGIAYVFPHQIPQSAKVPHQVYIKNMLITDRSEHILPDWFFFARALINSEELTPTASREDIHKNEILHQVKQDFEDCIEAYFARLAKTEPKVLDDIIRTHQMAIKAFAMDNPSFYKLVIGRIKMPTSQGELPIDEIVARGNEVYFVDDVDKFRQLKPMLQASGRLVVNGGYVYDTGLLLRLPHAYEAVEVKLLDDLNFTDVFHPLGWEEENDWQALKAAFQDTLGRFSCEVMLKRFNPTTIPAIYHITNQQRMTRDLERSRDLNQDSIWGETLDSLIQKAQKSYNAQLFVNVDNPVIQKLSTTLGHSHLKDFIELIYVNALLLGHYTPNEEERQILNQNLIHLIESQLS